MDRREDGAASVFLTILLVAGAGYTIMAFGMDWRTAAGRIGPGFFPRLVGLGIVLCATVSLARVLYRLRRARGPSTPLVRDHAEVRTGEFELLQDHREGGEAAGARLASSRSVSGQRPSSGSRTFALTVCAIVALQAGLTVVLLPLGAVVGSALFLLAALTVLNPGRHVLNLSVSVATPVALYLLFQLVLNAGLPAGVVPVM